MKIRSLDSCTLRRVCLSILAFAVMFFEASLAHAEAFSLGDSIDTGKAGYTLLLVLVLAILLETGLSTLFNWRIYLRYLEGKGWKVPIAVVSAYFFVNQFEIDAIAEILGAFAGKSFDHGTGGEVLTALIIAGGSSAVFTLFEKLGLRNPVERKEVAASMRTDCRLKIKLTRSGTPKNNETVSILVDDKIVGVIDTGKDSFGGMLGYVIEAGDRKITLESRDANGNSIDTDKMITIAPGATTIEKFELTPIGLKK